MIGMGADDRRRLNAEATAKIKGDPALQARLKERLREQVRERVSEGRLPPGLVACAPCGSAHAVEEECVEARRAKAPRPSATHRSEPLGGLAS